jgi:sugar lactone lactonase YvrE
MEPSKSRQALKRAGQRRPMVDCLVDARAELAQSLVWDDQNHRLFWIDTPAGQLFAVNLTSGVVQSWSLPCAVSAVALCRDGRVLVVLLDGVYLFDLVTHDLHFLTALEGSEAGVGLDGGIGPDGAFWICGTGADAECALLRVAADGTVSRVTESNALASCALGWSADGRTMYGADRASGWLYRWAFDPLTGGLSDGSHLVTHGGHPAAPSGCAVDIEGAYWSCDATSACVQRFSSNGEVMMQIALPVPAPTTCCFGGSDLRLLLVASRRGGLGTRTLSGSPLSGGIFMIPVDIAGVRVRRFGAAVNA